MSSAQPLMRDAFIDYLYERARLDRNIMFVSADFGAAALDRFRADLPEQFIHAGIAEQHMVDFGAGLALSGKQVFLYGMAPFITLRCIEQIKCVIASMHLPVTLIAVGVGLGYDHATLTHFTPEDIACLRSMNHIEVLSPADAESAAACAELAVDRPAFRYIRLERKPCAAVYQGRFAEACERGFAELISGDSVAIVACGYMTHKALKAAEELRHRGVSAGVIDIFRIKPIDANALSETLAGYRSVLSVEEQLLEGGFGGAVGEAMLDAGCRTPLRRLGIKSGFSAVNGDRDHLHDLYGIDTPHIVAAAHELEVRQAA